MKGRRVTARLFVVPTREVRETLTDAFPSNGEARAWLALSDESRGGIIVRSGAFLAG